MRDYCSKKRSGDKYRITSESGEKDYSGFWIRSGRDSESCGRSGDYHIHLSVSGEKDFYDSITGKGR